MTKGEAIIVIRQWQKYIPKYNMKGLARKNYDLLYSCWAQAVSEELIQEIRKDEKDDPIQTVRNFWSWMENILAYSDDNHTITHTFASTAENIARDILLELQKEAKHQWV